jgi:hypothetical protein
MDFAQFTASLPQGVSREYNTHKQSAQFWPMTET